MSRLSNFRDLLSRVEEEYIMLMQKQPSADDVRSPMSADEVMSALSASEGEVPKETGLEASDNAGSTENPKPIGIDNIKVRPISLCAQAGSTYTPYRLGDQDEPSENFPEEQYESDKNSVSTDETAIKADLHLMSAHSNLYSTLGPKLSIGTVGSAMGSVADLEAVADPMAVQRVQSLQSSGSIQTSINTLVFPVWWNPDGEVLKRVGSQRSPASDILEDSIAQREEEARWVLSPLSFPKLHWDLLGYSLLLYVAWAMPFQVAFGTETLLPRWMHIVDVAVTIFFSLDILLNFNTGFVSKGKLIRNHCTIARRYGRGWFLVDLVTCFPFDMLDPGAAFTISGRLLQVLRGLKLIRFIRLVQTLISLQSFENSYFHIVTTWKRWFHCAALVLIFVWNVHVLSCVWSALQPASWKAPTYSEALRMYFDGFVEVCLAMCSGSRLSCQTISMQFVEMFIAVERVCIVVYLCVHASCGYGMRSIGCNRDAARAPVDVERALQYLRLRGIGVKTQIEVLRVLHDITGVRAVHADLENFSNDNVPTELQQKIKVELWHEKLMTMGVNQMIASWNREFCNSLAMSCQEEVFPTGAVLFDLADSASAAYYIVAGEFEISSPLIDDQIPNFTVGMWLGEDALVNSGFRRGLRAVADCLSSVMTLPSDAFQTLLRDLDLLQRFDSWVEQELWRGICGRCGRIGEHFQDSCPLRFGRPLEIRRGSGGSFARSSLTSGQSEGLQGDAELRKFLRAHDLGKLLPNLLEFGIFTLSDLEDLELDEFTAHLSSQTPPVFLSRRELKMLSPKNVNDFSVNLRRGISISDGSQHFIFLSHYKMEAGTEAALMLSDLEQIINEDALHVANDLVKPIFLDSEDLTNLVDLQKHVRDSMNVVLLLTNGVLSRPWCLMELVTASRNDIPVSLVQVDKIGSKFEFPGEGFYADLLAGKTLDDQAKQLLESCGIDLATVENTLRNVFQNIAFPYAPHRSMHVRHAELQRLLANCSSELPSTRSSGGGSFRSQRSIRRIGSTMSMRSMSSTRAKRRSL